MEQVNDGYCDCPVDGSDEPGTSACAPRGRFYCQNEGYMGSYIMSSRVGDGVCEDACCDGSDEAPGVCPNVCAPLAAAVAAQRAERVRLAEQGLAKKKAYVKEGNQAVEGQLKELASLQAKKVTLENKVAAAKAKKESEEGKEKAQHDKTLRARVATLKADLEVDSLGKEELVALYELLKKRPGKVLKEVLAGVKANAGLVDEKEKEEKGSDKKKPFFDGQKQKGPVAPEEDEEDDDDEDDEDDEMEEELDGEDEFEEEEDASKDKVDEDKKEEVALDPTLAALLAEAEDGVDAPLPAAEAARKALQEAETEEADLTKSIQDVKAVANEDYGDDNEFYALRGKCFSTKVQKYTYEMCPYKDAQQLEGSATHGTRLGTWQGLERHNGTETGNGSPTFKFVFGGGQKCWNGPERSLTVFVSCGTEDKVLGVDEPSMCEYTMQMLTPAACVPLSVDELAGESFKVEL